MLRIPLLRPVRLVPGGKHFRVKKPHRRGRGWMDGLLFLLINSLVLLFSLSVRDSAAVKLYIQGLVLSQREELRIGDTIAARWMLSPPR